ncbi:sensor domain-containing diguanylate cyclase [Aliagarivorans marinus]|uniref:sensor domain-containing diguanylate cyclase n=1 Tax=Aliagarivorans marinus TaxID=561965 RepID=UPI000686AF40|nr:diguanylate cyclase [Aliagarivorans marinus]
MSYTLPTDSWLQLSLFLFLAVVLGLTTVLVRVSMRYNRVRSISGLCPGAQLVFCASSQKILYCNEQACELFQLKNKGSHWRFPQSGMAGQLLSRLSETQVRGQVLGVHWNFRLDGQRSVAILYANHRRYRGRKSWFINAYEDAAGYDYLKSVEQERTLFGDVLNSIPEFIYFRDAGGRLLGCNSAWASFHGQSPSGLSGKNMADFMTKEELEQSQQFDEKVLNGERCQSTEWFSAPDDQQILLQHNVYPLRNPQRLVTGVLSVSYDVTKWHQLNRKLEQENQHRLSSERKLGRQNSLIRTVFNSTPDPLGFFDDQGVIVGANEPFAAIFGGTSSEVISKHLSEVVEGEALETHLKQNQQILDEGEPLRYEELVYFNDGQQRWYEVIKGPYLDDVSGEKGVIYITRDVTERKETQQQLADAIMQLEELSFMDSLTQVANRRSFDERLSELWVTHTREELPLSLLLLDIDCFKQFNDNYGHQKGDEALKVTAGLVSSVTKRGSDLVARYGGEEFAVLLPNTEEQGAEKVAGELVQAFEKRRFEHLFSKVKPHLTVSVGVATIQPAADRDYGELVAMADELLYKAKNSGRARYCSNASESLTEVGQACTNGA